MHRIVAFAASLFLAFVSLAHAEDPDPSNWESVLAEARGEIVYFNAWGGDPKINDYLAWAGEQVEERYGVRVVHVKLDDTAEAITRILTEKSVGRNEGGAVDLVWVNGENFASMKKQGLLLSAPWATGLPNWQYVDEVGKPTVLSDFTVPTDGLEAPWGMAQLVFYADSAALPEPPRSIEALAGWIAENPGRFTYPQPPDFTGTTFLKQLLVSLAPDPAVLDRPVTEESFAVTSTPVFAWLDAAHPNLWRQGRAFPRNYSALRQRFANGEIDIAFAFNPSEAASGVASGELPGTVRSFVLDGGTLGNTHFVAIPYNANAKAGAMVVADFLMSPEAQARKQDPQIWGDPTVLDLAKLAPEDKARFDAIDIGAASLKPEELGSVLPEPHPSWVARIETEWARRYGVNQ